MHPQVVDAASKLFAGRPEAADTVGFALNVGGNPVLDKLTADHLTKSLDLASNKESHDFELKRMDAEQKKADANHKYEQAKSDRHFEVFAVVILVALLVFTVLTFRGQPTIMTPTPTGIAGIFTGFVGGIGYGKSKQEKKD